MAATVIIVAFVREELSYDDFYKNAERIFRVAVDGELGGELIRSALSSAALAPLLKSTVPEVEAATRVLSESKENLIRYEGRSFMDKSVIWADRQFIDVFEISFVSGGRSEDALVGKNSVLISERARKRIFGEEEPIGKMLEIDGYLCAVQGVMKDFPENSHLAFDFVGSLETFDLDESDFMRYWANHNYLTYFRSADDSAEIVQEKLRVGVQENIGEALSQIGGRLNYYLQPITDIHLKSNLEGEFRANGNLSFVVAYCIAAGLVLTVACANFANLTTARNVRRAREVGMRKVFGARRPALVFQFVVESTLLSFVAMMVAIAILACLNSQLSELIGKELTIKTLIDLPMATAMVSGAIVCGLASGVYPAFALSRVAPVVNLRGSSSTLSRRSHLVRGLIVFQFVTSGILIVVTFLGAEQLEFMKGQPLGFDKDNLIAIVVPAAWSGGEVEEFQNALTRDPRIRGVTRCSDLPGFVDSKSSFRLRGSDVIWDASGLWVDYDFFEVMGITLVDGRTFERSRGTDGKIACIVNEALVERLGGRSLIGEEVAAAGVDGGLGSEIVGVVGNFNFGSLSKEIRPLFVGLQENQLYNTHSLPVMLVRIGSPEADVVSAIEKRWREIDHTGLPFEYEYVDVSLRSQYKREERLGNVIKIFAGIALCIACVGLVGLTAYATQLRTKEIAIRKVLGGSVVSIGITLTQEFTSLVIASTIISWPIAYALISRWLEGWAYRIEITPHAFLGGAVVILATAWVTIGYYVIRAVYSKPVAALRHE